MQLLELTTKMSKKSLLIKDTGVKWLMLSNWNNNPNKVGKKTMSNFE